MANLTRIDPLDDLFRGFFVRPVDLNSGNSQAPSIKMDVKELEGAYQVHAELPGVKKEDIHVVVDGNLITSRQPDDIPAFNEQLIKALAGS